MVLTRKPKETTWLVSYHGMYGYPEPYLRCDEGQPTTDKVKGKGSEFDSARTRLDFFHRRRISMENIFRTK